MRNPPITMALMLGMAALAGCGEDLPYAQQVSGGKADAGRVLLARYQCTACHRIPGVEGPQGGGGPALDTVGRASYLAGHLPNQPDMLQRWIVDPSALKPGTAMPAMGVAAEDARHMAAYLYTLR